MLQRMNWTFLSLLTRYILGTDGDKTPILIDLNATKCDLGAIMGIYNLIKAIKNPTYVVVSGQINAITSTLLFAVPKEHRFTFENCDIDISTIPQIPFMFNPEISKANMYVYERLCEDTGLDKKMLNDLFQEENDEIDFYYALDDLVQENEINVIKDLSQIYDL